MDKELLKNRACTLIDENAETLISLTKEIGAEPELGYKEYKTSAKVAAFLRNLGMETEEGLALTGVKAKLKPMSEGPNVAVLGELDGIICPDSPLADPSTGATHTCGHNLQLGIMMGAALGLKLAGAQDLLGGNITFMAVPSEEFIEITERMERRKKGDLHFLGGKQELIYRGAFDDVDIAMMLHAGTNAPEAAIQLGETGNGFIAKMIRYVGRATHAAAAPHEGINALNAAVLGINAINALRETFIDDDHVRVHFIITKGGETVNSVPADVRLEAYVRGKTMKSIDLTHEKFDRAFRSGGDAVGARTEIQTIPGYLPLACSPQLNSIFAENAGQVLPKERIKMAAHFDASTDMGDICHLMPAIHPYFGGVTGALHSKDFTVVDYTAAVLTPAKITAMTVVDLLADGAERGNQLVEEHQPLMSKKDYLATLERYFRC